MEMLNKLKSEAEEAKKLFTESWADVEAAFEKIEKTGKNNIEGIVEWMKHVKLISSKEHEDQVREELNKASDKKKITLKEFKDAVVKMMEKQKKDIEELGSTVKEHGARIMAAFEAGSSTLQEAWGNTSKEVKENKSNAAKK